MDGATVVITHKVRQDRQADYERWMHQITPFVQAAPGYLDWHLVQPIPGLSETYAVIIRFDTQAHLQAWMHSPIRTRLIARVRPLLETGDGFFVSSGLDFWFAPAGARAQVPRRWKQFLVTWSAIFPLVPGVTWVVTPILRHLGLSRFPVLVTLVVTGTVVLLMVYVVMPRYTTLVRRWLFS